MEERPDLCSDCQKKKIEEGTKQDREENKEDPMKKRRDALRRAEKCRFFHHHGLFDTDGKEDSLTGKRTCSLTIKHGCGHEVPKYTLCMDWFDGKLCGDWEEAEH